MDLADEKVLGVKEKFEWWFADHLKSFLFGLRYYWETYTIGSILFIILVICCFLGFKALRRQFKEIEKRVRTFEDKLNDEERKDK